MLKKIESNDICRICLSRWGSHVFRCHQAAFIRGEIIRCLRGRELGELYCEEHMKQRKGA